MEKKPSLLLCVEDIKRQRNIIEMSLRALMRSCSHKNRDGTDATTEVPVSGERWCSTCGTTLDG